MKIKLDPYVSFLNNSLTSDYIAELELYIESLRSLKSDAIINKIQFDIIKNKSPLLNLMRGLNTLFDEGAKALISQVSELIESQYHKSSDKDKILKIRERTCTGDVINYFYKNISNDKKTIARLFTVLHMINEKIKTEFDDPELQYDLYTNIPDMQRVLSLESMENILRDVFMKGEGDFAKLNKEMSTYSIRLKECYKIKATLKNQNCTNELKIQYEKIDKEILELETRKTDNLRQMEDTITKNFTKPIRLEQDKLNEEVKESRNKLLSDNNNYRNKNNLKLKNYFSDIIFIQINSKTSTKLKSNIKGFMLTAVSTANLITQSIARFIDKIKRLSFGKHTQNSSSSQPQQIVSNSTTSIGRILCDHNKGQSQNNNIIHLQLQRQNVVHDKYSDIWKHGFVRSILSKLHLWQPKNENKNNSVVNDRRSFKR